MALRLTAAAIIIILFAANVTIANAHKQGLLQLLQLLTNQPATVENGTAEGAVTTSSRPAAIQNATTFQSTDDSFRVQVPDGWVIHDVDNTRFALATEVLQGYGILAQLCPEEQQQEAPLANAGGTSNISSSISSNSNSNSCQRGQEIIYFVRYPNLGARLGFASDAGVATTNNINITHDTILAYQMQKLQEVGYRDIRIVNSVDTTINIKSILFNNNVMATAPAKLVEMTYSTDSASNETRTGYFLSTATDATARNLGMITGYGIFYEGNSAIAEGTTASSTSEPPAPVQQVFDSFELIAGPEVEQTVVAALRALVAQAEEPKHAKEKEPADDLTVEIISDSIEGVAPAAFEFDTLITGGTEPYTISWDFGDGSEESNGEGGLLTFNEAGTYTIAVSAIDSTGQTASDNIEVTVEEPPTEGSNQPDLDEPDNNSGSDNLLNLYDSGSNLSQNLN